MASRMERYYKTRESKRRIVRNESLYQTIYEDETYSNIEGVVATPKANEIDIEKIKELIASREREKNQTRKLERKPVVLEPVEEVQEEKNYDIRDVLIKAKDSRETTEEKHRNLNNTEYNILRNIKINNKYDLAEEDELKELINTITSTSLLNKMSDNELSLNMFDDLKSDTMFGNTSSIKSIIEEKDEDKLHNTDEMDKSFFTSSLGFKEKDFEQLQDLNKSINKNNKIMKVILIILFVVIALILGLVVYNVAIK